MLCHKRYKAAGGKKAISVQRLNILAIDSLDPDLDNVNEVMLWLTAPYVSEVRAKAARHQKLSTCLASNATLLILLQKVEPFTVMWKLSRRWRPTLLRQCVWLA